MFAPKRRLLATCSIALSIFASAAFADSGTENPRDLQITTGAGSYASVPAPRAKRAQATRRVKTSPDIFGNPFASMASGSSDTMVAEARRYIGTNPTNRRSLWCGAFMNLVLERTGHSRGSSDLAKSFASYGTRVSGPQVGAIAVMSRGEGGGHVGIVTGVDSSGNPIIISGNHNNRVEESVYPRGRIFAYVMPDASGPSPANIKQARTDIVGESRSDEN